MKVAFIYLFNNKKRGVRGMLRVHRCKYFRDVAQLEDVAEHGQSLIVICLYGRNIIGVGSKGGEVLLSFSWPQ